MEEKENVAINIFRCPKWNYCGYNSIIWGRTDKEGLREFLNADAKSCGYEAVSETDPRCRYLGVSEILTYGSDKACCPGSGKTLVYGYQLPYHGSKKHNGVVVKGVNVELAIRVYKNEHEIGFYEEEPDTVQDKHLCDIYHLSYDQKNLFMIEKDTEADGLFRQAYGWDRIDAEVVGYTFDLDGNPGNGSAETFNSLPEEVRALYCPSPVAVTETVFKRFLSDDPDGFIETDSDELRAPYVIFINK